MADSILVTPDSLDVSVGQAIEFFWLLRIEARVATGEPVPQFVPFFEIEDKKVARMGPSGLQGGTVGRTRLLIKPMSFDRVVPSGRDSRRLRSTSFHESGVARY